MGEAKEKMKIRVRRKDGGGPVVVCWPNGGGPVAQWWSGGGGAFSKRRKRLGFAVYVM
ncbi:sterile alpha and TIR motif-containing protein 1 isoform X1 [Sesbania bispinosa]|nr:sterile alpha and TIR motif-containing protein 1 isoform X1 [Sesbania bispinosa]